MKMYRMSGVALLLVGIMLLAFPTAIPLTIEQRILTGISIGVDVKSGMAPLTTKISAILWELRDDNRWYMLPDKTIIYTINNIEIARQYSSDKQVNRLEYTFAELGTYDVQIKFEGDVAYAPSESNVITVTVTGPYILTVMATEGGSTAPPAGRSYEYYVVATVYCYAYRDAGYEFLYWTLDGEKRTENPIAVVMDRSYTLTAYFEEAKPHFYYTLAVNKTEVPDVAEWRYPVIAESEMVEFTVITPPEYPITQPVQLEVQKAGVWQLVREFVIVDGKGTAVEAPGLYGTEGDVLTFRVYDAGTELESNHVSITLLVSEPKPTEPTPEEPIEEVPPEVSEDVPIDETVDEPVTGVPKIIAFQLLGSVLATIGLLLILASVFKVKRMG